MNFLTGLLIATMIAVWLFVLTFSVRSMIYAYDSRRPKWVQHLEAFGWLWIAIAITYTLGWVLGMGK